MKIIHLLNSSSYSGAENVAITIIKEMRNNHDFIYASPDGNIRDVLNREKIPFEPLSRLSISEIKRIYKKYHPDVIHAHDFRASITCAMTGMRVPIISHLHNNSPWIKKYGLYSFVYLFSSYRYEKILLVSNSILDEYVFSKLIIKKSLVIFNPFDAEAIRKKTKLLERNYKYDIAFIGRFSTQKNPIRFVTILSKLLSYGIKVNAVMIGNGELEIVIKSKIKELSLDNNINLTGFLDNPYELLAQSKVLCITSDWEGYGLVAVEALSLGVPVVATPVGGLTDIVTAECGNLCSTDDEFCNAIVRLISNTAWQDQCSRMAIKRADQLSNLKNYCDRLNNIYFLRVG